MTNESDKKDPKWLKTKSDGSKVIVEGSAEIPMTADTVFYNPIQEFNRDLSIAAITSWHEFNLREAAAKAALKKKAKEAETSAAPVVDMIDANGESVKEPVTATPAEEVDDEVQEPAYKRLKASSIDPVTGVEQTRVAGMQKRLKAFLQKRAPDFKTLSETEYLELKKDAPKLTLLEALSATGLRSIRYAKEIDHIGTVIANDMEPAAVQAIQSNVIYNGLQEIVKPNEDNALHVFYKAMMDGSTKFDVIDLDPYGSATPFLDGAMQTVQENGFLCVTCTDMAVLAGSQSEACWIKYGAMSMPNAPYCHELGLRILLHSMQASAAKYKKIIEPFMSCSIDFYVRVFVRVRTSGALVKKAASLTSVVYHCGACKHFVPQPMGKCVETVTQKGGLSSKFGPARGPTANTNCEICGGVTHMAGPCYNGPLHNQDFLNILLARVASASTTQFGTLERMIGMLSLISEEVDSTLFYHSLAHLSSTLHCNTPSKDAIHSALLNAGYEVSETHASPACFKTNAPMKFIFDVVKAWCVEFKKPVKMENISKTSPAFKILSAPKSSDKTINFKLHPKAHGLAQKFRMVRFQNNPTTFWGPKSRPKKLPYAPKESAAEVEKE